MKLTRREFMIGCSSAIAAMAGGKLTHLAFAEPGAGTRDILVVVFLRGGCDGLGILSPLNDNLFQAARTGLTFPGSGTGAGYQVGSMGSVPFWLHPRAGGLNELYASGDLAFINACGLNNGTRSHFDAMSLMESGAPDSPNTNTGWLTRHINVVNPASSLPAIGTYNLPDSFLGSDDAVSMLYAKDYKLYAFDGTYATQQNAILQDIYTKSGSVLDQKVQGLLNSINTLQAKNPGDYTPSVTYPADNDFVIALKAIAQIIKFDIGLEVATVDLGGWDTHQSQVYYLGNMMQTLSDGLAAFYNDLSAYHTRLSIIVMSEFGRRLKGNLSSGTDHGHGNLAMAIGGNVNGGQIFGQWPGLENENLDHNVDLAITTDYRTILSELVVRRLKNNRLGMVFPQVTQYQPLGIFQGTDLPIDWTSGYKAFIPLLAK